MAMVLQQTSVFYDGGRRRKMYAVIHVNRMTEKFEIAEWTLDKSEATGAVTDVIRNWMRAMVEKLNRCPRLENGEAGRFYALRYRKPANMKRVECCRCGKRFYAWINPYNPQYENRVCGKCAIQKGEKNA